MSKKIQSYSDLLEEKNRLEILKATQKAEINHSWTGVKQSLTPVTNVFSFLGKITHRKHLNPLFDFGIDMAGDVLLRKVLLSKADWVTRLILPIFMKNYSSNVLGKVSGNTLFGKLRNLLSKKKYPASHTTSTPVDTPGATPGNAYTHTPATEPISADFPPGTQANL